MTTIDDIQKATSQAEISNLVASAAAERNCELDSSMPYAEQAAFFRQEAPKAGNGEDDMLELAELLDASEKRWFEVE